MTPPSEEMLNLIFVLLQSLDPSQPLESVLLRLHAVFGPMLKSALDLVDDPRGVTRVSLPSGRFVYQVMSGDKRYTLHIDPSVFELPIPDDPVPEQRPRDLDLNAPISTSSKDGEDEPVGDIAEEPITESPSSPLSVPADPPSPVHRWTDRDKTRLAKQLSTLYCPCQGFTYNTLLSEKTILCKHLLAVLIASRLGKAKKSETGLENVIGLLGFGMAGNGEEGVKMEI